MEKIPSNLRETIIYFSLLLLFSLLAINRFAPSYIDADNVIMSIMSLQKVTLFYWGEDRFANFIPLALSFIAMPHLNLLAHFFVFSLSFFALLFVCARLIIRLSNDPLKPSSILAAFGLLVATTFLCLRPFALAVFGLLTQPYSFSYLTLLTACGLVLWPNRPGWLSWISASLELFISTGFNPSILIPAIALGGGAVLVRRQWHGFLFVALASGSFFVWGILAKLYGSPSTVEYSKFNFEDTNTHFGAALDSIVRQFNLAILVMIVFFICLISLIRQMKQEIATSRFSMPILSFALIWLFVFSQNEWVRMNQMSFRYFFPVFLAPVFVIALALYAEFRLLGSKVLNGVSVLCIAFGIWYLASPYVQPSKYPLLAKARMDAKFAAQNRIVLIGGNYWKAWPTVFELMNANREAFGVALRAQGNREKAAYEVNAEYSKQGVLRILSFGSSGEECKGELDHITGGTWQLKGVEYRDDDKVISVFERTETK
jgi:hypothetical protein